MIMTMTVLYVMWYVCDYNIILNPNICENKFKKLKLK